MGHSCFIDGEKSTSIGQLVNDAIASPTRPTPARAAANIAAG
jgi:hypothetical protein